MIENDDRRITRRIPINVKVVFSYNQNTFDGFTTDISPLGLFIENKNSPPIGTEIELSFTVKLQSQRVTIRAKSVVERIVDRNEAGVSYAIPGFGVSFLEFENSGRENLDTFVALKLLQEKAAAAQPSIRAHGPALLRPHHVDSSTETTEREEDSSVSNRSSAQSAKTVLLGMDVELAAASPTTGGAAESEDAGTDVPDSLENRQKRAVQNYMSSLSAFRQGDYEGALKLMRSATHLNPNKPSYFNTLREMEEAYRSHIVLRTCQDVEDQLERKHIKEAMDKLKKCHDTVPDDPRILQLMARAMVLEGKDLKKALLLAKKALSLRANDSENYYVLGLVYKAMGEIEKAKGYFLSALQIGDHNESAKELHEIQKS